MASVSFIHLLTGSTVTATSSSDSKSLEMFQKDFIAVLKLSGRTQGTYNIKLQHSADNVNFFDVVAFTEVAAGATANEIKQIVTGTTNLLPHVRVLSTVTVAVGDAVVDVKLYFDREK